jgi:predicted TIM-barrel fold metal-dependent hydrolase
VWDLRARDQPWTVGLAPLRRSFPLDDLRPHLAAADDLRPYVEAVLECFGPERAMWGSDWPVCLLAGGYERWHTAALELTSSLGAAEREAVFGATAASWYQLEKEAF